MRTSRLAAAIGVLVAVGCVKVAERAAVIERGYGLGRKMAQADMRASAMAWLESDVVRLHSPVRLAAERAGRKLDLVAWSMAEPGSQGEGAYLRLAAARDP
ncbi:MAG TPA: hypothetical protein VGB20_01185 [bacterium]